MFILIYLLIIFDKFSNLVYYYILILFYFNESNPFYNFLLVITFYNLFENLVNIFVNNLFTGHIYVYIAISYVLHSV